MIAPVYRGDCFLYTLKPAAVLHCPLPAAPAKIFIFLFSANDFTFVSTMTTNNTYFWQFSFYYYFSKNAGTCV